jgi:hypothetical protein
VDQNQALEKARQFARTRYTGEAEYIVREHQRKIFEMREQAAAHGTLMSSVTVGETARINAQQIEGLALAQLDAILEGYELHGIVVDDQTAINICDQIIQGMNNMIHSSTGTPIPGMPAGSEALHQQLLEKNIGLSANLVKTQVDRRRLVAKKTKGSTTIYNVQGDNARVNVNSNDHSVNVVTKSKEEFFATLHQRIESGVPDGEERQKILTALTALQESHGKPSFAQRVHRHSGESCGHQGVSRY